MREIVQCTEQRIQLRFFNLYFVLYMLFVKKHIIFHIQFSSLALYLLQKNLLQLLVACARCFLDDITKIYGTFHATTDKPCRGHNPDLKKMIILQFLDRHSIATRPPKSTSRHPIRWRCSSQRYHRENVGNRGEGGSFLFYTFLNGLVSAFEIWWPALGKHQCLPMVNGTAGRCPAFSHFAFVFSTIQLND